MRGWDFRGGDGFYKIFFVFGLGSVRLGGGMGYVLFCYDCIWDLIGDLVGGIGRMKLFVGSVILV